MPPLKKPKTPRSIRLPPRYATLAAETDVLVVGGGPAGLGAALGAAQTGARVILAERHGFLGGNATAALVMPLMSFHTQRGRPEAPSGQRIMPQDHGPGEPVVAGVLDQLLRRLMDLGGAVAPSKDTGYTVPFDPELFKIAALDLLDGAGVELLLHAFASGVVGAPSGGSRGGTRVDGVIFETKSGPVVIRARTVVDCTGDGDIAALAGAPFEVGREGDGLVQPMTLMFRMVEFEQAAFQAYTRANPGQWRGVHGLWDLVRKANEAGELDLPREDILFFGTLGPREVAVNSTRVTGGLGIDVFDLTHAEHAARRQMQQIATFFRKWVPGFQESYIVQSGVGIGIRETRRISGEYRLDVDDVLSARKFSDGIARCAYPVDIHNPSGSGTRLERLPPGESYDIPLRCLLPQRVEGIVVAGRCISGSHEAHSSYRVMPTSVATGQAAGACAAIAVAEGRLPRDVDAAAVQAELRDQGATLSARVKAA